MMDFELLEDAMVGALRAGIGYLRAVRTYGGELEDLAGGTAPRYPAAYVVYGGSEFSVVDGWSYEEAATYTVMCVGRDARGEERGRKGSAAGAGAYEVVRDVMRAIAGETFGLDAGRMRPVRVTRAYSGGGVAVYAVQFASEFDVRYER